MNISVKQAVPAWKAILGASGPEATKAAVTALTHAVRAILSSLEPGEVISTTDLGDRLWPKGERDANTLALRRRMFNLLLQEGNSILIQPISIATAWLRIPGNGSIRTA